MSIVNKRHAIYYSYKYGRNDGAPLYYLNVLKNQLKLDVTHLLPEGDTSNFGSFGYHWWIDWGEDGLPWQEWEIPKDGGKTIYVCSDTHLGKEYRFNKALKFDYVFFNQLRAIAEYQAINKKRFVELSPYLYKDADTNQVIGWLPHAAEPQAYPKIEIIKKYDVGFVGHVQETENYNGFSRVEALDRLFKEFPNFYYGSRHGAFPTVNLFEDAAKKFSLSKIVFNISIKDDYNMRCNEVLMTGSFLLTNWIPEFDNLEKEYGLKDGVHYVSYHTLDEMVEKASYYLEHEEERENIAEAGYKLAIEKMTYRNRIETILKIVGCP